jgi:hypothetical protein
MTRFVNSPTAPITPASVAQAAALGYPAVLSGFTPAECEYWFEPGLPWLLPNMEMPVGHSGIKILRCTALINNNYMAPRFPPGCVLNVAPVVARKNLVIGKVYLYVYTHGETGEEICQLGRLHHIGDNYLTALFDNNPIPALWLLRADEREAVWDVYEVTHYLSHPGKPAGGGHE